MTTFVAFRLYSSGATDLPTGPVICLYAHIAYLFAAVGETHV